MIYHDADFRAFIAAIEKCGDDEAPWLVFADWLDDRGESLLSRLVRQTVPSCWPVYGKMIWNEVVAYKDLLSLKSLTNFEIDWRDAVTIENCELRTSFNLFESFSAYSYDFVFHDTSDLLVRTVIGASSPLSMDRTGRRYLSISFSLIHPDSYLKFAAMRFIHPPVVAARSRAPAPELLPPVTPLRGDIPEFSSIRPSRLRRLVTPLHS